MNVKKCVRALLCLYLTLIIAMDAVKAQALKVGDTLPPELWSMPLQVINHPQGKETITLSEYKDQLIILDFWATWCSPCIAMLPKQDSLQRQFKDQLQILPVTYQTGEEVNTFMEKYEKRKGIKNGLPKVVGDNVLRNAFPHTYLPHYVWIDTNGRVKAITSYQDVNAEKITAFLNSEQVSLTTKADPKRIPFDSSWPFLINGNGGDGSGMVYHTVFAGYTEGLRGGYYTKREPDYPYLTSKITVRNLSLPHIFALAHGEGEIYLGKNRMIYETPDSSLLRRDNKAESYADWARQNTYCYEIIVPPGLETEIYKIMIRDIDNMTKYTASVQKRKHKYYALQLTSDQDKLKTKGGESVCKVDPFGAKLQNQSLDQLYGRLNALYLQHLPIPFINETGYTENVDIEISANMSSIESLNEALEPYHLTISECEGDIPMLVISDKNTISIKEKNLLPTLLKQ